MHVHEERIPSYAADSVARGRSPGILLPPGVDPAENPDAVASYVIALDSVNFGSGYFPHLRKRPDHSGYRTIEASLHDLFRDQGSLSAQELRSIDARKTAAIFGQNLEHPVQRSLMSLFAKAWNELGSFLLESFAGSFSALVEAADHSAARLAEWLTEMPMFRDVAGYDGREVAFYKRAQIVPADLALAFSGEGFGWFHDLDQLTSFADNLVPHVLRSDGILEYEPSLEARIHRGELIVAGSNAEVEIRACAVHAVELIVAEMRRIGAQTSAMQIDHILWNRGQTRFYKDHPRHRTRTAFY